MSITHDMPAGRYRGQIYRRNRIPEAFVDIVADHRSVGRTDDDLAMTFGITVEALHKRFRDYGIPVGRRWRDIEDHAASASPITKADVRRINAPTNGGGMPGTTHPRRRAS